MKKPKFYRIFNYNKQLLPNQFLAQLENNVESIEQAKKITGYSVGYPGWGILYYVLLSHLIPGKHNNIVETGTNLGCSTIVLAQALKDSKSQGKVYTIELNNENYNRANEYFIKAGVSDVIDSRQGDSKELLLTLTKEINTIRIAFLHACHLMSDVLREFEIIYPCLQDNSIVIFDNTYEIAKPGEDPRVFGALKEIKKTYGGNLINFEFVSWYTPGMAAWQKDPFSVELNE